MAGLFDDWILEDLKGQGLLGNQDSPKGWGSDNTDTEFSSQSRVPQQQQQQGGLAGLPTQNQGGLFGLTAPGSFLGNVQGAISNPLTMFGLGLASGRTPQEGFGNALQAQLAQQKIAQANLTGDIKEYQYAIQQGFKGSFADWQKTQANIRAQYGLNPQWVQKPDGTWVAVQLSSQGPPREVQVPGGGRWSVPGTWKDTGTAFENLPNRVAPYGVGGQGGQPGQPTTSATDAEGRPVVQEPAAPVVPGGPAVIQKNLIGQGEQQKIGQGLGTDFTAIQKDARIAINTKNTLTRMSQLNDQAYSGAGAPGLLYARSLLETFGVPPGNVPAGEELNMLSNRMIMEAANGSLGNQVSDKDTGIISGQNPQLVNTKEGRAQIIDTGIKVANRKIEVAKMASDYRRKNGNMDGFNDYLSKWSEEHSLFPDAKKTEGAPAGKTGGGGGKYNEGDTIYNPKTKERRIYKNGEWVPIT